MIYISIFNNLFGKFIGDKKSYSSLSISNSQSASFNTFSASIYESGVTRSCIHAIAANAAKFKAVHITRVDGNITQTSDQTLTKLLALRPNDWMSAYDFYYKLITQCYVKNNSFAMIDRALGKVYGLYPINYATVEALEFENEVYLKFSLLNGKLLTLPYADVIHLRRFYFDKDIFGESNQALYPTISVIETTNQGLEEGVKSSAILRGILKFTTMLKKEDIIAQRDEFIKSYLNISNNGGVAATDSKMDYVPINNAPMLIDAGQMKAIRDQVYMYFNVNENFVMNNWNEDQWNAVYESVLEPLAIQLSQEFTSKLFSNNSQTRGNEVMFEANRLAYASNKTKISFVKEFGILGGLTINEMRDIFNMAAIEGGDKRVQTLNVVNAATADTYQNGGDTNAE